MDFGEALCELKNGEKVTRIAWGSDKIFIVLMSGLQLPPFNTQGTLRKVNDRTAKFIGEDKPLNSMPYIAMYNKFEEWCPGWLASQGDTLKEDWKVVY